mmetsp:Transcript_137/g.389  ORF Transcript_137/g.389 Transcript_137/m.389 type:complete len:189 (-) Transcript_137:2111-2677(-)
MSATRQTVRRILAARTHFETLDLPVRHVKCAEVKASFLALVKQVHPDHCGDRDAPTAFAKVSEAYEALKCPARRGAHLDVTRDRMQRDPHVSLAALDALAQPWVILVWLGLFFGAEALRMVFAADEEGAPMAAPETRPRTPPPPVAPAFSVNPGAVLVGPTHAELEAKLHDRLRRKKDGERRHDDSSS